MDGCLFSFELFNLCFELFKLTTFFEGEFATAITPFVHGFARIGRLCALLFAFAYLFLFFDLEIVAILRVVAREVVHHAIALENEQMIDYFIHEVAVVAHHNNTSAEVS